MGSDAGFEGCAGYGGLISIHAPRMGIDVRCLLTRTGKHYFNPRSPDGERHYGDTVRRVKIRISIHAPRMGSDLIFRMILSIRRINFNPRSPDGERLAALARASESENFNPRSPDGERQRKRVRRAINSLFQSTLPGWGATAYLSMSMSWT